jgi:hypothetical protein
MQPFFSKCFKRNNYEISVHQLLLLTSQNIGRKNVPNFEPIRHLIMKFDSPNYHEVL